MQLMPFPPNSYPFAIWQVRFTGTFMERGGYNDIGGMDNGAVWYPSNPVGLYSQGDDAHHGSGQCNVQYRGDFYFDRLCVGPTNSFDTQLRAAFGWQPVSIRVNLLYADTFYDETVTPTATLRLTTVPEPASISLVVFGLAGIAVRRRRWGS